ncbi:MAG: hypothetical protein ABI083_02350, partial [Lapillicoccus sp.]
MKGDQDAVVAPHLGWRRRTLKRWTRGPLNAGHNGRCHIPGPGQSPDILLVGRGRRRPDYWALPARHTADR